MRRALVLHLAASRHALERGPLPSQSPTHRHAAAGLAASAGARSLVLARGTGAAASAAGDAREVRERLAAVLAPDVLARVLPHLPRFAQAGESPPHVAVGLSGGVDSAVTAWLLKTAGYPVTGVLMRNWDEAEETGGECGFEKDQRDARAAARAMGIPLTEVDFVREYWHAVFEPFLRDFDGGSATPNPDLACNRHIKFGALLHHCTHALGADLLATGHYARVEGRGGEGEGVRLLRGVDPTKDQSYFLASVRGEALKRACFPLGGLTKREVRGLAAGVAALPTAVTQRRSSAGICFIGRKRDFGDFIQEYMLGGGGGGGRDGGQGGGGVTVSAPPGAPRADATDRVGGAETPLPLPPLPPSRRHGRSSSIFVSVEDGAAVGEHGGLARYTHGQRARVGGAAQAWFVVGKDARAGVDTVYVAPGATHPALYTSGATVGRCFWVAGQPPHHLLGNLSSSDSGSKEGGGRTCDGGGLQLLAQTRYGAVAVPCRVRFVPPGAIPRLRPSRFCTPPTAASPPSREAPHEHKGVSDDGDGEAMIEVMFDSPERAVTPGQALVLYDGDVCLGGGVVLYPGPSLYEVREEAMREAVGPPRILHNAKNS